VLLGAIVVSGLVVATSHVLFDGSFRVTRMGRSVSVTPSAGSDDGTAPSPPVGWSRYVAPDGTFSIVAPGYGREVVTRSHHVPITRIWFPPAPSGSYDVFRFLIPRSTLGSDASLLGVQVRSTIRRFGGRVVGREEIEAAGYPGVRLWIETKEALYGVDLFVAHREFFQLDVTLEKDPPDGFRALARSFLDSFEPFPEPSTA
jgi:hypothetical protein